MWEQISSMIRNGQTYTEIATYVAKTRRLIDDDEEESHFDPEIQEEIVWDDIVDVCCDIMEEMKIDMWSNYSRDVIDRCHEVIEEQVHNGETINNAVIKTISSFIKFLEDRSIGNWRDNLICEDDDDDLITSDEDDGIENV